MEIFASRLEEEDEFAMQQREENNLMFAVSYMTWVDSYLDDVSKQALRYAFVNFDEDGQMTYIYQILSATRMLDDNQMDMIRDCLYHRILRTRLIIKICAKGLLKCIPR